MRCFIAVLTVLTCIFPVCSTFPPIGHAQSVTLHSSNHDLHDPVAVTNDGDHLYFGGLNDEGISTILKMPSVGGPITVIASGDPFVKISGLTIVNQVLYVADTGNPFDGPTAVYRINLLALPHDALPFADLVIGTIQVRMDSPQRVRIEGRFVLNDESDGVDVLNENVTVWFGDFSQTIFSGSFAQTTEGEGASFTANAASGVTEIAIFDDRTFRIVVSDIRLTLPGFDMPIRVSLHIGNDAGEATVMLDEAGRFGMTE